VGADEPRFIVLNNHVGLADLTLASTQTLDLPSLQAQASLDGVLDKIVKARPFVDRNLT
jgi:hypothetical protein